ncbi:hypothetical protein [Methanobrevibacter millerae]|uniref:Uncharacterized protein n=1 Tax=Methanobrevibacter millerae TaxID=230361 RepID=A0A1G5WJQ5_9EURY|nr:hypothetical protein [Methanobrevibacter millerae]SDA57485.1 hypothetical protein SAMN02910315_01416 [Methanobrevibacter millerae]
MNGQKPQMRNNTTYIRFKNTDNLKENPERLIAIFKKYNPKIEVDSNSLNQLIEGNIGKTFDLVFNINTKNENDFENMKKEIAIEVQKLGYKINSNFIKI